MKLPRLVTPQPAVPVFNAARFETLFDSTRRWFAARSQRERRLLVVLAAVALPALLYLAVWQPLAAAHRTALADIRAYEALNARLRASGPDVARIAATRRTSPATVITDSAARAGLTIRRLEPQGPNTEVTLEEVPFDKVVEWLAGLERDAGLTVGSIRVDRRPAPGIVTVQLTLKS